MRKKARMLAKFTRRSKKQHRSLKKVPLLPLFLVLCFVVALISQAFVTFQPPMPVSAEKTAKNSVTSFHYSSVEEEDQEQAYVLLLDCSGSTYNYAAERNRSARAFIETLPDNAYVAIQCFDCDIIDDLSKTMVQLGENRAELLETLDKMNDFDWTKRQGMNDTYMAKAMNVAIGMLKNRPDGIKNIILISDGVPDSNWHGIDFSQREIDLFAGTDKTVGSVQAAYKNDIRTYVIHTPGDTGNSNGKKLNEREMEKKSQKDVKNMCTWLNTAQAIDAFNEGVTASLTDWEQKEYGKVIVIDNLNQLSSCLVRLAYAMRNYQTYTMPLYDGEEKGYFSLPSGIKELMLYIETDDQNVSGSDNSFHIDGLKRQESALDFSVGEPVKTTSYGKYYSIQEPGSGDFEVTQTAEGTSFITVLGKYDFSVDVNLTSPTFSPFSQEKLAITVDGDDPVGLDVSLAVQQYDGTTGMLLAASEVKAGVPLDSLVMSAADSNCSVVVHPVVTFREMHLDTETEDLRLTLANDKPVGVNFSRNVISFWPFANRVMLGQLDYIVYDTETKNNEEIKITSENDQVDLLTADGVLYAVNHNALPLFSADIPYHLTDADGNVSNTYTIKENKMPTVLIIIAIALVLALVALYLYREKIRAEEAAKKREIEAHRLEQELIQSARDNRFNLKNTTPWHASVTVEELHDGRHFIGSIPQMVLNKDKNFVNRRECCSCTNMTVYTQKPNAAKNPFICLNEQADPSPSIMRDFANRGVSVQMGEYEDQSVFGMDIDVITPKDCGVSVAFDGELIKENVALLDDEEPGTVQRFRLTGDNEGTLTLRDVNSNGKNSVKFTIKHESDLPSNRITIADLG